MDEACALAVTISSSEMLPPSTASITRSRVIILVTDAGGKALSASCSNITFPVDASISMPLSASIVNEFSAKVGKAKIDNRSVNVKRKHNVFFIIFTSLAVMLMKKEKNI